MIIIFGTRGRIVNASNYEKLSQACPDCHSDLELKSLQRWFTLFFIPIFPIQTIDSFYRCSKCNASYKKEARSALLNQSGSNAETVAEVKKLFANTLIACMTYMAKIDGEIAKSEESLIKEIIDKFPDYKKELSDLNYEISYSNESEEKVHALLRESKDKLSSDAILTLLGQSAKVLAADGKIDKEEEKLMKEYLLICDLPKNLYEIILEKMKIMQ